MKPALAQWSREARQAAQRGQWDTVTRCANRILKQDGASAEGHYLAGLARLAERQPDQAAKAFSRALRHDAGRYDAAIELATLHAATLRHREAIELLERYADAIAASPMYLDRAGSAWARLGLHERAYPLFARANELQPGVPLLQANLAASAVYVGRIDEARALYESLLERSPDHQRHHYELSRIVRASDARHVEAMEAVLERTQAPPARNIFLYYALGKELEDLERWDEAFRYYEMAGDAAAEGAAAAGYRVEQDIELIDTVIRTCTADWLAQGRDEPPGDGPVPIFVTGLPRTGTTLTDRILSAHSRIDSVDETHFLEIAIERAAGARAGTMTPATLERAAAAAPSRIAAAYLELVTHKLGGADFFVEKLPENFLYLGFIAKAWPDARLVCLDRAPMDACFAMYKQSFFRYAYRLEDVARYYVAHRRLRQHWRQVLGERLVEVRYEDLVQQQERETRRLLEAVGVGFEDACLAFEKNLKASATASAAQVREKMHGRSIGRWRHFAPQLEPLAARLAAADIDPV